MIDINYSGSFKNLESFLDKNKRNDLRGLLNRYGQLGVQALSAGTPLDSGETANSWSYEVTVRDGAYILAWSNSHSADQVPIVVLLQYGHATRNGGFVEGIDFINPALQPIFDQIADSAWREVVK